MTELLNCSKRRDTIQNPPLKIMKIAICPLNKGSSNSKSVWISCKRTSAGLGDVQHRYTKNLWSKQPSFWQLSGKHSQGDIWQANLTLSHFFLPLTSKVSADQISLIHFLKVCITTVTSTYSGLLSIH